MSDPATKILALVPAYNEGARVRGVVTGAMVHLPVLVVDDGSTDDTATHAEAAGARLYRRPQNGGKGMALRDGFRYALEHDYDAVLTLDADGQHDPAEIPAFLQRFRERGADLIIGSRDFPHMPPVRRFANSVGRHVFSWALGQQVPDNQSGYRLVRRRLMQAMLESAEAGFEFEVEVIVVCVQHSFELDWVPIRTIYTGGPSHIRPAAHVRHFFRAVTAARRTVRSWMPRTASRCVWRFLLVFFDGFQIRFRCCPADHTCDNVQDKQHGQPDDSPFRTEL